MWLEVLQSPSCGNRYLPSTRAAEGKALKFDCWLVARLSNFFYVYVARSYFFTCASSVFCPCFLFSDEITFHAKLLVTVIYQLFQPSWLMVKFFSLSFHLSHCLFFRSCLYNIYKRMWLSPILARFSNSLYLLIMITVIW